MVSFWWTSLLSFKPWERIWWVLDGYLRHLLLMMSHDCLLAIRHKRGKYIWIGDFCCLGAVKFLIVSRWFIFYLYFFALYLFCFIWVVYDKGRYFDVFISVSFFTLCYIVYWFIFMRLFMIYVFTLSYMKSRSYFVLLVFSTHAFMHLLSVWGIYRLIQLCYYLYLQLIDSS